MTTIEPFKTCLFIPAGLKKFKLNLFERIGHKVGRIVRHDVRALAALPDDIVPIVGCSPELTPLIAEWKRRGRTFIYWDRGYFRRVFASDLPWGANGGYYRWHVNAYQMQSIREVPGDRWAEADIEPWEWQRNGDHIVVAEPTPTYARFHACEDWTARTVDALRSLTKRPLVMRHKEMQQTGPKLHEHLRGAHALVSHGSNAAVEAAIMGCPVFVDPCSAAALVGKTSLAEIESPIYPDRKRWLHSLAYCQFNERELVDGTLWRLIH